MPLSDQNDDQEPKAPACACGSHSLLTYANAEVARAFKEACKSRVNDGSFQARFVQAYNCLEQMREIEGASVVDLSKYRELVAYFVSRP